MLKSEFIASYAGERSCSCSYAEWPDGSWEWIAAHRNKLIPLVNFAMRALTYRKEPVNEKTLTRQFDYVISEWRSGNLEIASDGQVYRTTKERAKELRKENYARFKEYIPQ